DRLQKAGALQPSDPRLAVARRRHEEARAAAAAREAAEARRRQVEQLVADARSRLESGDLDEAARLLTLASGLAPEDPRVAELSQELDRASQERAVAEAAERVRKQVADLLHSASSKLHSASGESSQLAAALGEVTQALALDAANADARKLQETIQ